MIISICISHFVVTYVHQQQSYKFHICILCSSSSLRQKASTVTIESKHQLEKIAFEKCSIIIVQNLDTSEILPCLISQGLLTEKDRQILIHQKLTNTDKALYLLDVLPRKEMGFFDRFKYCLYQTRDGTGHIDIANALSASYMKEVMIRKSNKEVGS